MFRGLALALVALALSSGAPPASASDASARQLAVPTSGTQPAILVLTVEDFTRPYVRQLTDEIRDTVLAAPDPPVVYLESLDASRFGGRQYFEGFRDWLGRKYADRHLDLIVALGEDAVASLAGEHGEPWPDVPVLYLEAGAIRIDPHTYLPRVSGIMLEDHAVEALAVMKQILPATEHVALVYGAAPVDPNRWSGFADKVRSANLGLEPIVLAGLSHERILAAVARLPPHTALFILAPNVDARGRVLAPRPCEIISAAANAPSFTLGAQDLGCGVVGGLMRDWSVVGRLVADRALDLVKNPGAATGVTRVPIARYTTLAFDARQLARWNIDERRLPPGSDVRFRDPSLWRDHRPQVIAALSVAVIQTLLIGGLVFERRRRRRAELEARRQVVIMSHLDRRAAMGELATSLAHELNQPLNAILQNAGVAQMLLSAGSRPPALEEIRDIVEDIRKDDIRASEVIRRMRGLLQKRELETTTMNVNDVAEETVALVRPDARSRAVQVDVQLADGLPPILGDRVHLQQVLLNLILNGVDAVARMPPGRRQVLVRTQQGNGQVQLLVRDTGTGIRAEPVSDIFEPFYTTKDEGMGMGLAIARSIIEAHAGRMAAENNPDGGATVWFSVPAASLPSPPARGEGEGAQGAS